MKRPDLVPGTYHHIILRGTRGMTILHDNADWWECVRSLFYQNDALQMKNWKRELSRTKCELFERPNTWPEKDPLVAILAFCIHANHVHLLVKEVRPGGISRFMHRFPNSLSRRYNSKYGGQGTIFQGGYQQRMIEDDGDIMNVGLYVMVKNTFERYPDGGLHGASESLHDAFEWATQDPFSSFPDYGGARQSPIVTPDLLGQFFDTPHAFRNEAHQYMKRREEREDFLGELIPEED